MDETKLQERLDRLESKLDIILEETEQLRRQRRELEELKDDLMRVGTEVFKKTVEELDEIHGEIESGDIVHLGKKLLRNVNNFTVLLEQLENVRDFAQDFMPLSRDIMLRGMEKMDEMDRKGYFDFLREGGRIVDNIVTSFSAEDARLLADNIVTIMDTVKNLTQPDMLGAIDNAVVVYKNLDFTVEEEVSVFGLIRKMNSPEIKRGLAILVQFLQNLSEQQAAKKRNG